MAAWASLVHLFRTLASIARPFAAGQQCRQFAEQFVIGSCGLFASSFPQEEDVGAAI